MRIFSLVGSQDGVFRQNHGTHRALLVRVVLIALDEDTKLLGKLLADPNDKPAPS